MRLGWLVIMQPMQNSSGYCVLAWHRKPWWTWGIWWGANTALPSHRWGIWHNGLYLTINIGSLGAFNFQKQ